MRGYVQWNRNRGGMFGMCVLLESVHWLGIGNLHRDGHGNGPFGYSRCIGTRIFDSVGTRSSYRVFNHIDDDYRRGEFFRLLGYCHIVGKLDLKP